MHFIPELCVLSLGWLSCSCRRSAVSGFPLCIYFSISIFIYLMFRALLVNIIKKRWPKRSVDGLRAGTPLAGGFKACLWSVIGDLDYFVSILQLPNFNSQRPCTLCRCSLSGVNTWSNFTPSAPWRQQIWCMSAWKAWGGRSPCPLFDLPFTSGLSVSMDWMHSKYLGVDQYCYGSILALLTVQIMPNDDPQRNLNILWSDILSFYRENNTPVRYRYLNRLGMYLRKSGTPKLRGKAGEIRHLAPAMLYIWNRHKGAAATTVHTMISALLKESCQLENHISDYKDALSFPPVVAKQFSKSCENMLTLQASLASHFIGEGLDLFTLTSKAHMLQHIAMVSGCVSPRLVARSNVRFVTAGVRNKSLA